MKDEIWLPGDLCFVYDLKTRPIGKRIAKVVAWYSEIKTYRYSSCLDLVLINQPNRILTGCSVHSVERVKS